VDSPLPLLVVLTGPTGTGKSTLAMELAERLEGSFEIISADSAQVYRGMNIGTAKSSMEVRARLPHHLVDIRNPNESYSAGDFVRDAREVIQAIVQRGRTPLLVGGTMLYLRALRDGLAELPTASASVRQGIDAQAQREGWPSLHAELARVDPKAAARIAQSDAQRIQRALEVYRLTGVPITQWQRRTHGAREEFRWLRFALIPESRSDLQRVLAARFEEMMRNGLLEEARQLITQWNLSESHPSMRAVGYRQLSRFFRGECSLPEATQQAITATSQLAKRQLTWLRREQGMTTLQANVVGQAAGIARAIQAVIAA
jgi:tRNA dimethylallyltransferase